MLPFPRITQIADVLPAIEGRAEFTLGVRDGYQFIDYNYALPDSFDCAIRRECRGIKFDDQGNLIARPLHKFFNLGEKPAETPDFAQEHSVMEKLDGSMIHPARVNGELVFMTRAGVTDHAKMALDACRRLPYGERLLRYCEISLRAGITPIFEFTAPYNQIVVRYTAEALTLLAARFNTTGEYVQLTGQTVDDYIHRVGANWEIPVVRTFGDAAKDIAAFQAHTKALKDQEGYVVRVGQQFVKMKADDYVVRHRVRSGLVQEKDVLKLVLDNGLDDVLPMLPAEDRVRLEEWSSDVSVAIQTAAEMLRETVEGAEAVSFSRGEFARTIKQTGFPSAYQSWCFSVYDGKDPVQTLREAGIKQTTSGPKARAFLEVLSVDPWVPVAMELAA